MNPARLVAKDHAAVDDWRRAPDGTARLEAPDKLAFVRAQAMQIAIAGADVDPPLVKDGTGPDADVLTRPAEMAAFGHVVPNQFAAILFVGAHHSVFCRGVN